MFRTKRKYAAGVAVVLVSVLSLCACSGGSGNSNQDNYANAQVKAAQKKWGQPAVSNFTEYHFVEELYELRDRPDLVTYVYEQEGMGSGLICMGEDLDYGVDYATQLTPPTKTVGDGEEPVAEPDALFPPLSSNAYWLAVLNPTTNQTQPALVNGTLRIWPFELPCQEPGSTVTSVGP